MKTALIDADTLIYEASLGAEKSIEWHDELWTLHAFLPEAKAHFTDLVDTIKSATGADRLVLALSDGDASRRWRNTVMATYKMNRKKVRRPVVYGPLRDFCHKEYHTFERPTLEGDDVLGILMTHPKLVEGDKVCVSIDKDLKTIPGEHYNYGKQERYTVSEVEADYNHMMQTLTGDTTDGYPGCPGVGKVTAARLIAWEEEMWPKVVAAYKKAGLSEEVALQNARVARILRAQDYNFKTKEVVLWNPS